MVVVMLIGQGVKLLFSSVDGLTPQIESPVNECAGEFIDIGVFHDDRPLANRRFTPGNKLAKAYIMESEGQHIPMSNGHESPILIPNCHIILFAGNAQVTDNSSRAAQLNADITAAGVVDIHSHSDMF